MARVEANAEVRGETIPLRAEYHADSYTPVMVWLDNLPSLEAGESVTLTYTIELGENDSLAERT